MASAALELLIQLKDEASSGLAAITGSLGGVGKAALTVAGGGLLAIGGGLTAAIGAGLGFNNSMEQVSAQLMAFTKDGAQTAAILDMIKERAASTPFAFEDMATAATALLPASKMAGVGLEELVAQAEILAASNPAEGLEGAAFALKEAVGGDFQSAIERFNLPRQYINQLKEEGVPNLEILSMAMGQLGLDADLVSGLANTASGRWSTFLDTLTNVAAEVSKPIFEAFSSGLAGVQTVLDANMPAITAFAGVLAGQLASAIQWLAGTGVPALIAGWASLQPALIAVGDALTVAGAMFAQLWIAVQPLIPSLQGALVPALVGLAAVVGGGIVVALGSMVAAMVAAAAPIVALVAAAGALYAAWSSNFLGIRDVVTGALSAVLGVVMAVTGQIVAFWQANGTQILATVTQVWGQLQAIIGGALQIVMTVVQTVYGGIAAFIQTHSATIQAVLSAAWGALAAIVTNALNIIQNVIRTVLAVVKGDWAGAWEGLKATVAAVWNAIGAVIKAGLTLVSATLRLLIDAVISIGSSILSAAASIGRSIVDGIVQGIKNGISAVVNAARDLAQSALSAAMGLLDSHSPSREFAKVGLTIPQGVGVGIGQGTPALTQNITRNLGTVIDSAKKVAGINIAANQIGRPIAEGIGDGFGAGMPAVKKEVQSELNDLVKSAKQAMAIRSPSKVMAQEIGAPIVDGIVAGLVQRSPKAVQAMLDLASSMFDVVSKGVEAFGKLTQLGTIPQSAILNFSDAIQRTLTEFAERQRNWDKAAMSAASQFARKAGEVVDVLVKGVDLLSGIADLAMPTRGAISGFAEALAWMMAEITRVSTRDLRIGLTAGVEFASAAGAIVDVISKGVEALNSLSDFVRPAPGVIQIFTGVVAWLVSRFVEAGQWLQGQALGGATAFAAAAGQIFAVVASGVDAMLKLGEFVRPAPGVIQMFTDVVAWLVSRFVEVGAWLRGPALAGAAAFADGAGKVLSIVGAGVDGLLKLGEFIRPAPGVIQTFADVIGWLVSRFVEIGQWIGQRGVAAAAAFAEGAGKAIGIIGSGVDGFIKLADFKGVSQQAIDLFAVGLSDTLASLVIVAQRFAVEAVAAAAIFGEGAGKAVGFIGQAVDSFTKLADVGEVPATAIDIFAANVVLVVTRLQSLASTVSADALTAAGVFGANVAATVKSVNDALQGFATLGKSSDIGSSVLGAFVDTLNQLIADTERILVPAAENIGAALVFGIADGIQAQIPYLVATLQNAAYTMVDTVQGALGIASPSKVFEQIGQYAGQGMVGGMAAMQPALAGAGAGLGMAAVGGAGAAVSGRAGGGGGDVIVNIGTGAFTLNGAQGGIGEKELRRLAQLIKEEIANERGTRG